MDKEIFMTPTKNFPLKRIFGTKTNERVSDTLPTLIRNGIHRQIADIINLVVVILFRGV